MAILNQFLSKRFEVSLKALLVWIWTQRLGLQEEDSGHMDKHQFVVGVETLKSSWKWMIIDKRLRQNKLDLRLIKLNKGTIP